MPIRSQYNNNINNNYIIPKNKIYHGKSSSYSGMNNMMAKRKELMINTINNNQYNYPNQIQNNYYSNYNRQIPIETDINTNNNYNKYNVTNNYYGNQIINNNFNYYPSSRNIKEMRNMNNPIYNNNYINNTTQPQNNQYMDNSYNNQGYNKMKNFNNNLNLNDNIIYDNNYNNYIVQTPKSDMNYMKKSKSKEKFKNMIKNIDVNMDYQDINFNNGNQKSNIKNKKNLKIKEDNDDNINYFDISNFKSKLMKMSNVKVLNDSNENKDFNYENKNMKVNSSSNSRKNSKVKNKISSKIPHNYIKNIKLYPTNITESNDIKFNSGNSKKTMSKIPVNMKRKLTTVQKNQNDEEEESQFNKQLYNTNAFSNSNLLNNVNEQYENDIPNVENKTNRINNEIKFSNKDNNLDIQSETNKIKNQINSIENNFSKYKTTTELEHSSKNNIKIKSDIFSIKSPKNNNINNENIDNTNLHSNINKSMKTKKIIFKRAKAKSNLINNQMINEINIDNEKEKEKEEHNKLEEEDLSKKINLVKIEKIENKLIGRKIELKKDINKLNKSQSNETMNVSEVSNDDKIMKINDFSSKIKNNILLGVESKKDFDETKKINNSKKFNNININEIIKSSKRNSNNSNIKNISYISKSKKMNKEEKKNEDYTKDKNYFKKCIYKSIAGKDSLGNRKINQDLYLVQINFINIEGFNLFGVLDGHGENGHKVAVFARDFIILELSKFFSEHKPNSLLEVYPLLKKNNFSIIKEIYQKADEELSNQNFNSKFSGTTCVIVFQIGHKLICSNVGDSRAILVYTSEVDDMKLSSAKIYELSLDQKPELPEEKKRIYKMGGIVDQMLDSKGRRNGPFRVWAGKNNYPGLAMSRCIGDLKGKSCGLISEPEIIEYTLDENSKYMVICSDGVWEFSNNEDIMSIGIEFYLKDNIEEFIDKIIKVSEFWWEKEDVMRDDITAIVVFF